MDAKDLPETVTVQTKDKLDDVTWMHMNEYLSTFYKKNEKHLKGIKELKIAIKEFHPEGERKEYEMTVRLLAGMGEFHAVKEGWDAIETFEDVMDALARQFP